ncbi:MAG: hypothetical protein R3E32_17930 [Chitinophagales bacterium]
MITSSFNSLNNNFYPSPNSLKSEHYQPLLIGDMLNVQALAKESQKIKDSKEKRPN